MSKNNDRLAEFMKTPGYSIRGTTLDSSYPVKMEMILINTLALMLKELSGESKRITLEDRIILGENQIEDALELHISLGPPITDGRIDQIASKDKYHIKYDMFKYNVREFEPGAMGMKIKPRVLEHHVIRLVPVRIENGQYIEGPNNRSFYSNMKSTFETVFDAANVELFDNNIQCVPVDYYNPLTNITVI